VNAFLFVFVAAVASGALAQDDQKELAKEIENPVTELVTILFSNNWGFGAGPRDKTRYLLNTQLHIPISLNDNWYLITRPVFLVISQPELFPGGERETGLGDINVSAFLSPAKPDKIIWGVGPIVSFPTATNEVLGTEKWAARPTAAAVIIQDPWVCSVIVSQLWSFAGTNERDDVNLFVLRPVISYNLGGGSFLVSAPIITAHWEADSSDRWTAPVGGGVGKIFKIGKLPLSLTLQAFYNVEKPDSGAEWQVRFAVRFLFPK
jgi:hypothetical protein